MLLVLMQAGIKQFKISWQQQVILILEHNQIEAIPANFNPSQLQVLDLEHNHITYVNPQILQQVPLLNYLNLNQNPLTPENIIALRNAAVEILGATGRDIEIIADDIGDQYLPEGDGIKGSEE